MSLRFNWSTLWGLLNLGMVGMWWFCLSATTNFSQGKSTQCSWLQFGCKQGVHNDKKVNRPSLAKYNYEGGWEERIVDYESVQEPRRKFYTSFLLKLLCWLAITQSLWIGDGWWWCISVMVAATQCTKAVYNKRKCNTITGTQYSGLLTPGQKASTKQLYDITNDRRVTMSISIGAWPTDVKVYPVQ